MLIVWFLMSIWWHSQLLLEQYHVNCVVFNVYLVAFSASVGAIPC